MAPRIAVKCEEIGAGLHLSQIPLVLSCGSLELAVDCASRKLAVVFPYNLLLKSNPCPRPESRTRLVF